MGKTAAAKITKAEINQELTEHNKPDDSIVQALQKQTANAFIMYLNYKHYHWQTFGPLFRDLHELFDEFAEEVYATIDELAERIRMIGQDPVSRIDEFQKFATITSAEKGGDMRSMVREANENSKRIIYEMRQAIKTADENEDPGTADILTRFVQIHEKQEWWLRDILERRDGLTEETKKD